MKSLSRVRLFVTRWTVACQAPPTMGFSRQQYWSGLPLPPPGALPNPGVELRSPALWANSLPSEPQENLPNPDSNQVEGLGWTLGQGPQCPPDASLSLGPLLTPQLMKKGTRKVKMRRGSGRLEATPTLGSARGVPAALPSPPYSSENLFTAPTSQSCESLLDAAVLREAPR